MRTTKPCGQKGRSLLLALASLAAAACLRGTDPQITVSSLSTNQIEITVTNATAGSPYGLFHRPRLEPPHVWRLHTVGVSGQTNFVVDYTLAPIGFYQVITGNDWDNDGVTNAADAASGDTNVGYLTITIQSPSEGGIIY